MKTIKPAAGGASYCGGVANFRLTPLQRKRIYLCLVRFKMECITPRIPRPPKPPRSSDCTQLADVLTDRESKGPLHRTLLRRRKSMGISVLPLFTLSASHEATSVTLKTFINTSLHDFDWDDSSTRSGGISILTPSTFTLPSWLLAFDIPQQLSTARIAEHGIRRPANSPHPPWLTGNDPARSPSRAAKSEMSGSSNARERLYGEESV